MHRLTIDKRRCQGEIDLWRYPVYVGTRPHFRAFVFAYWLNRDCSWMHLPVFIIVNPYHHLSYPFIPTIFHDCIFVSEDYPLAAGVVKPFRLEGGLPVTIWDVFSDPRLL